MAKTFSNQYFSFGGRELELNIMEYNRDSFEVQIINKDYARERGFRLKSIVTLALTYIVYILSFSRHVSLIDAFFLLTLGFFIHSTLELVKSEKVLFVAEFALQMTTEKFLSRESTTFIPSTNIKDIVINEVIEDLAIKHILIIRTKGALCHRRPIIMIFRSLQPRIECLEIIYSLFLKKSDSMRNLIR